MNQNLSLLLLTSTFILLSGCRGKIEVKARVNTKPQAPAEETTEDKKAEDTTEDAAVKESPEKTPLKAQSVSAGITTQKLWFQSRDVVTINLSKNLIQEAQVFSLHNVTKGDNALALPILTDEQLHAGPVPAEGFQLRTGEKGSLFLDLFSAGDVFENRFFYGPNTLKVTVTGPDFVKTSVITFTVSDYSYMTFSGSAFEGLSQTETIPALGQNYEGWINTMGKNSVSAEGYTLSTGLFNLFTSP